MIGVSDAQPGSAFDFIRQVNTTAPATGSCDPGHARRTTRGRGLLMWSSPKHRTVYPWETAFHEVKKTGR